MSQRQRRIRRLGLSTAERQRAERARQVWSWDFVEDQTENGSRFRSDNGPEFIAYALQDWLAEAKIKTLYIRPWENGHIESYHDKLRDECLNRELFGSLREASIILEAWRVEYNERRPHSSLRDQTPGEFARQGNPLLQLPSGLLLQSVALNLETNHNNTAELQF